MHIQEKKFSDVNLNDDFFDSLRSDYPGFDDWFRKKTDDFAYTLERKDGLEGFLYLKIEDSIIEDVKPELPALKRLKIGTFKVNPHGTRLGERFIKIACDYAIKHDTQEIYTTIFQKHETLMNLFKHFGFHDFGNRKQTGRDEEVVLIKQFSNIHHDLLNDYPLTLVSQR